MLRSGKMFLKNEPRVSSRRDYPCVFESPCARIWHRDPRCTSANGRSLRTISCSWVIASIHRQRRLKIPGVCVTVKVAVLAIKLENTAVDDVAKRMQLSRDWKELPLIERRTHVVQLYMSLRERYHRRVRIQVVSVCAWRMATRWKCAFFAVNKNKLFATCKANWKKISSSSVRGQCSPPWKKRRQGESRMGNQSYENKVERGARQAPRQKRLQDNTSAPNLGDKI